LAFSVGLVGFYIFSADKPDGLEDTMEDSGLEEGEPVWHAPLDYGDTYASTLIMGFVGFAVVFMVLFGYLWLVGGKKDRKSK